MLLRVCFLFCDEESVAVLVCVIGPPGNNV
jgi:hypothetical protein